MKQIKNSVLALVVMTAAGQAMAADSVDLKVVGTITPTACTPALSNGGTVDYGNIQANTLSATAYTNLASKDIQFTITCDAPTKVAFQVINGRMGSVAGATEKGVNGTATAPVGVVPRTAVAGLGLSGTSQIGGYSMVLSAYTVDGKATGLTLADTVAGPWDPATADSEGTDQLFYPNGNQYPMTFADVGSTTPTAFTTMSSTLSVQAYLNMTSQLDLSKEIKLDGLATIKLTYL